MCTTGAGRPALNMWAADGFCRRSLRRRPALHYLELVLKISPVTSSQHREDARNQRKGAYHLRKWIHRVSFERGFNVRGIVPAAARVSTKATLLRSLSSSHSETALKSPLSSTSPRFACI